MVYDLNLSTRNEIFQDWIYMLTPSEEYLTQRRKEIPGLIASLVASTEGPPEERRRQCLMLLNEFERAIDFIASRQRRFAHMDNAIEAVVSYLDEQGIAMPKKEIVEAALKGGYKGGVDWQAGRIAASIEVHINSTGKDGKNGLRELNGKIGRKRWEDSRF